MANGQDEVQAVMGAISDLMQECQCPICLDFVISPKKAPCQHNFCEDCINHHIKNGNNGCPTCRYRTVNKRSLSGNRSLAKIADIVRKMSDAMGILKPQSEGCLLPATNEAGLACSAMPKSDFGTVISSARESKREIHLDSATSSLANAAQDSLGHKVRSIHIEKFAAKTFTFNDTENRCNSHNDSASMRGVENECEISNYGNAVGEEQSTHALMSNKSVHGATFCVNDVLRKSFPHSKRSRMIGDTDVSGYFNFSTRTDHEGNTPYRFHG